MATPRDPYVTLGVRRDSTDAELRSAFRRLVQLHHPDHNGGSPESARRFEEIEAAYTQIRERREHSPRPQKDTAPPPQSVDPDVESRLADIERELQAAHAARERARRAAQEAAAATRKRPTDEQLGYVTTDDSLGKILADARVEFSDQIQRASQHAAGRRLAELIDELEAKLTGETRRDPPG
jgi:curved DNA-binding protein CbpA